MAKEPDEFEAMMARMQGKQVPQKKKQLLDNKTTVAAITFLVTLLVVAINLAFLGIGLLLAALTINDILGRELFLVEGQFWSYFGLGAALYVAARSFSGPHLPKKT